MAVKTQWNSTLELFECVYWLQDFTCEWLKNPPYSDYRPLSSTQDGWTIVKQVLEVLKQFQYWTLWTSKRHTVTLHHIITVNNDVLDHMDGVMWAVVKTKTQCKDDLSFAMKFMRQKLSKYYAHVTPMTCMLLISAHILDPLRKMWLFTKWDHAIDINPDNETSYTTQYQQEFPKSGENKYCAKHRRISVIKLGHFLARISFHSATASGLGKSSVHRYDLSSDDERSVRPNSGTDTTPRRSNRAAPLLIPARLYTNSLPEAPRNRGQVDPNLNDYNSDHLAISSRVSLPDVTDWWHQQDKTHSKFTDLSNVAHGTFAIVLQVVGVEESFSLGRDVIGWRQSKTTGETHQEKVIFRYFAQAYKSILAGGDTALNTKETERNLDLNKQVEGKNCTEWPRSTTRWRCGRAAKPSALHRRNLVLKKTRDSHALHFGCWRDRQNILVTLATWWCSCILTVKKITFATSFVCKGSPGGQTQVFNVHWIRRTDHHPAESDEDSAPESISNNKSRLNGHRDFDIRNASWADREAYFEY